MVRIIKENKIFLIVYLVALCIALGFLATLSKGDAVLYFNQSRGPYFNGFFRFMSFLVETWFFVILGLIFLARDYRMSIMVGLVGISALVFSGILKVIFSVGRPMIFFEELGLLDQLQEIAGYAPHTGYTSFPSGHATAAFGLFFLLSYLLKNRLLQGVFALLAIFSALSRVYLTNHFLQDVVVGSLLGITITTIVVWSIENLKLPKYPQDKKEIPQP